jgi:salicylate hydroxylase
LYTKLFASQDQVALLGDAGHPTLPYQAQGAAMAVEDGAVLGKLLGLLNARCSADPSLSRDESVKLALTSLLKFYEQLRKTRTTRNVHGAIVNRKIFHLEDGILQSIRDLLLRYAGLTRETDWTWVSSFRQRHMLGFDVLEDCKKAFALWKDFDGMKIGL